MPHVDGNAIAGLLAERLGVATTAVWACGHCGRAQAVGETSVYFGLGVVVRCAGCTHVLMVLTERRGTACIDLTGVAGPG